MQIECVSWSGASASEVNGLGNGCNESPQLTTTDELAARTASEKTKTKNPLVLSTGINKRFSFVGGVARKGPQRRRAHGNFSSTKRASVRNRYCTGNTLDCVDMYPFHVGSALTWFDRLPNCKQTFALLHQLLQEL